MSSNSAASSADRLPVKLQCKAGSYTAAHFLEIMELMPDLEQCEALHKGVAGMMRTLKWPISPDHDTSEVSRTRWKKCFSRNERPSTRDTLVAILCHRIEMKSLTGFPATMIEDYNAVGLDLVECMSDIPLPDFISKSMPLSKWNALKTALAVFESTGVTADLFQPANVQATKPCKREPESSLELPSHKKIKTDDEARFTLGSRANSMPMERPFNNSLDNLADECKKQLDKCKDELKKKYEALETDLKTKMDKWDEDIRKKSEELELLESSIEQQIVLLEHERELESERLQREHKVKLEKLEEQIKAMKQQM